MSRQQVREKESTAYKIKKEKACYRKKKQAEACAQHRHKGKKAERKGSSMCSEGRGVVYRQQWWRKEREVGKAEKGTYTWQHSTEKEGKKAKGAWE